jgi:hypothetical protein
VYTLVQVADRHYFAKVLKRRNMGKVIGVEPSFLFYMERSAACSQISVNLIQSFLRWKYIPSFLFQTVIGSVSKPIQNTASYPERKSWIYF